MKILLLGSNGQLGHDIVKMNALSHDPFMIQAWTRNQLDISTLDNIKTTLEKTSFDVLINCTSYHQTDQVEKNPHLAFIINAFAVKEMANVCREKKALFLHISTDYVFNDSKDNTPLEETACPAPLNIYGASKLMGESLSQAVHDTTIIFRVASLFGVAGASGKGGNFVETMIRIGREKGTIHVIADQIMSPTSTTSIANMILMALRKKIPAGIYHAVNTGSASWYEFAKNIIEKAQIKAVVHPIKAAEYPSIAVRPSYSALSNQKLARLIGQIPSWQEALDSYLIEKNGR